MSAHGTLLSRAYAVACPVPAKADGTFLHIRWQPTETCSVRFRWSGHCSAPDVANRQRHLRLKTPSYALTEASSSKCPRRCSHASRQKLGTAAIAQITKNQTQPA